MMLPSHPVTSISKSFSTTTLKSYLQNSLSRNLHNVGPNFAGVISRAMFSLTPSA